MSKSIEHILAECLAAIEEGRSPDRVLDEYPQMKDELRQLIETAAWMQAAASRTGPSTAARHLVRHKLFRAISALKTEREGASHARQRLPSLHRLAVTWALSAALVASLLLSGTAYAADGARPGQVLHTLDIVIENLQLNLAGPSLQNQLQLRLRFALERLEEAGELLEEGDEANLEAALELYAEAIADLQLWLADLQGPERETLLALLQEALVAHAEILATLQDQLQANSALEGALDSLRAFENLLGEGELPFLIPSAPSLLPLGNGLGNGQGNGGEGSGGESVRICHWASPGFYVSMEVSISGLNAHMTHPNDIIPPVYEFLGLNWDATGQAIYEADCETEEEGGPDGQGGDGGQGGQGEQGGQGGGPPEDPGPPEQADPPGQEGQSQAQGGPETESIRLCHWTNAGYQDLEVKEAGLNAHTKHPNDIIAPVGEFPGQNWDSEGQAIHNSACQTE